MSSDNDSKVSTGKSQRMQRGVIALLVLGVLVAVVAALALGHTKIPPLRQAQWQQVGADGYRISAGSDQTLNFDGSGNRVLVSDTAEFHFSTNQDFSVEAWIRAYPVSSRFARWFSGWLGGHPKIAGVVPARLTRWLSVHAQDNDFGVTPVIDKHYTPSTIESIGFQLYLDSGRLACQPSSAPMRQLHFQNFISSGPNLQDGGWHHVALVVQRNLSNGGKLYVDGQQVLKFDPTQQNGDLSNNEPLRIGNHANPGLRCRYKGSIGKVTLYRRALAWEEVRDSVRSGHP